jgi:ABC-type dipeptide/oligopeptide/nickel transport system ATPase component
MSRREKRKKESRRGGDEEESEQPAPAEEGLPPPLVCSTGTEVPWLDMKVSLFLDHTTVVYGPSGTGKTIIVKHIMNLLDGPCAEILVINPTAGNGAYDGYVDPKLIHLRLFLADPLSPKKDDGKKGALRFLEAMWKRQEMKASIYFRANRLEPLSRLFERLPKAVRVKGAHAIGKLNKHRVGVIAQVREQFAKEAGRREEKIKEVNDKFKIMIALIYKKYIAANLALLTKLQDDLTDDELYSLFYLDFNPRLVLVFDDAAAELKPLFTAEILRKMFYQNRHVFLTPLLLCQDDTDLPANLRKNGYVAIFTEPVVALSNFERASNKYAKPVVRHAQEVINEVFEGHRKLAYIRDDPSRQHFYCLKCPYPRPKMFGSEALHELCESIKTEGSAMDKENPYWSKFSLDKK